MTTGDTSTFAIESEITRAFERPSWRGLGFFVIHVAGQSYGVKSAGQSMLACSFDEVGTRINGRGTHQAPFAEAAAIDIANAYNSAVYLDNSGNETHFGMSEAQFTKTLYSNSLVWAPDGDEAFDDSSYVLQFDVGDRARLIAFNIHQERPNSYTSRVPSSVDLPSAGSTLPERESFPICDSTPDCEGSHDSSSEMSLLFASSIINAPTEITSMLC